MPCLLLVSCLLVGDTLSKCAWWFPFQTFGPQEVSGHSQWFCSSRCGKKGRKFLPVSSRDAQGAPGLLQKRSMVSLNHNPQWDRGPHCFCGTIPHSLTVFPSHWNSNHPFFSSLTLPRRPPPATTHHAQDTLSRRCWRSVSPGEQGARYNLQDVACLPSTVPLPPRPKEGCHPSLIPEQGK